MTTDRIPDLLLRFVLFIKYSINGSSSKEVSMGSIKTHKLPVVFFALLLLFYFGSYFGLRHSEVHRAGYMYVSFDKQGAISFPISIKAFSTQREMYKRHGSKADEIRIEIPRYNHGFYSYMGYFENKMPLRYKFYLPAIHTESIFWTLYSIVT